MIRLFFAVFQFSLSSCLAQAPEPVRSSFELRPPSTSVVFAAEFDIAGQAQYPEKYSMSLDLTGQTTSSFVIRKVQMGQPEKSDGIITQKVVMSLVPFDLGNQTFPSLSWTLAAAGGKSETLKSPPIKITVNPPPGLNADSSADIRDIKPPLSPVIWPFILAVLLIAGAAAYYGYMNWPSRVAAKKAAEAADLRPPHEIALEQLRRLDSENLNPKPYYDRLSEILRVYLERRFDIPALVLTSSDLIRQMRQAEIDRTAVTATKEIMDQADLVKFAKFSPTQADMSRDCAAGIELVASTAPKPDPQQLPDTRIQSKT